MSIVASTDAELALSLAATACSMILSAAARLSPELPAFAPESDESSPPHAASVVAASTAARASAFERICAVIVWLLRPGPALCSASL